MWSKKELIDKGSEFWAVLARGATLQAACDAVGVIDEPDEGGGRRPAGGSRATTA